MIKKLNFVIVSLFCAFIGISNVDAIKISVPKEVKAGEQIKVTFSEANISSVSSGPLYEFGNNKADNLTRVNFNGFSGIDKLFFTSKDGYVTYTTKEINVDYVVTFSIKDLNSNAVETASVNVKSKNPTTTSSTSTTTTTKTTTTTAAKSNNANLKSLEIKVAEKIKSEDKTITTTKTTTNSNTKTTTTKKASESTTEVIELVRYTPEFKATVYEYTATVSSDVKKVTINATMEDTKANMVISDNASKELKAGENNKITITVTAEDGSKKAYVINIKREALKSDATLKGLTIEEDEDFDFESDKYSYRVNVARKVNILTIGYELSDNTSTIKITGNENLKNGSKVKILVTAQDGTKKEYILNILKEEITTTKMVQNVPAEKNPLIIMGLSLIAFGLLGGIIYVIKK